MSVVRSVIMSFACCLPGGMLLASDLPPAEVSALYSRTPYCTSIARRSDDTPPKVSPPSSSARQVEQRPLIEGSGGVDARQSDPGSTFELTHFSVLPPEGPFTMQSSSLRSSALQTSPVGDAGDRPIIHADAEFEPHEDVVLDEFRSPNPIDLTGYQSEPEFAPRRVERRWERQLRREELQQSMKCSPWARLMPFAFIPPCGGIGIGHERVMFAPFFIDSAEPFTHLSLQYENGWDMRKPDRSEYFWAAPNTGPGPERSVDVMTLTARMEAAAERASAIFAVPLRAVDPELNPNTSGIGDLTVGGKVVLVSGKDWVVTQQTLTYINTGPASRGMGTGHVSFEPGLLARYRWTNEMYFHGQLRYVIPVSGTDDFPGEVLIWGAGTSWIWRETDAFAVLPTFEVVGISFLDGQRTTAAGAITDVDGETTIEFLPGVRFVLGPQGDLGLPEFGISGGASVGDSGWFSGRLLIDVRWSY